MCLLCARHCSKYFIFLTHYILTVISYLNRWRNWNMSRVAACPWWHCWECHQDMDLLGILAPEFRFLPGLRWMASFNSGQSLICGPASPVGPGSLLKMRNLRPFQKLSFQTLHFNPWWLWFWTCNGSLQKQQWAVAGSSVLVSQTGSPNHWTRGASS